MHIVAMGWSLVTGVVCGILDVIGTLELFPVCWVGVYLKQCAIDDLSCNKGPIIGWLIVGDLFLFVTVSITLNNLLIYRHVRSVYTPSASNAVAPISMEGDSNMMMRTTGAIDGGEAQRARWRKVAWQGLLYALAGWLVCVCL